MKMELALALVAAAVPQVQVRSAKFGTRMAELTLRFMCAICLDLPCLPLKDWPC